MPDNDGQNKPKKKKNSLFDGPDDVFASLGPVPPPPVTPESSPRGAASPTSPSAPARASASPPTPPKDAAGRPVVSARPSVTPAIAPAVPTSPTGGLPPRVTPAPRATAAPTPPATPAIPRVAVPSANERTNCLLYTSDAADE